jgi:hypothetical protein
MKKGKRAKQSSIAKKRHSKKPAKPITTSGEPIPHCNTYGQWVSELLRMDDRRGETQ